MKRMPPPLRLLRLGGISYAPLRLLSYPPLRLLSSAPPSDPLSNLDPPPTDTPPRLSRPLGLPHPPRSGENTGIDTRTWAERRADFTNYDKHLARRAQMTRDLQKSYWRDFNRLSVRYKGKSFLAPSTLFKADKALFFPNLHGRTLAAASADTTPVLAGRVSVVSVFSSAWAEGQVATFVDGLEMQEGVQRVDVNVELNRIKGWIVRLFLGSIRKRYSADMWERYFLIQRGLDDDLMQRMGYLNGRVGYVYLVDWECRIRWAGSGRAEEGEKEALRRGVRRLAEEWKGLERGKFKEVKEEEKEDDEW